MTETESGAAAPATPYRSPPIVIMVQYLKDLSFESPNAPAILNNAMDVRQGRVGIDLRITPATPPMFEVVVKLRVEATHEGKTAYLVDLEYACLAQIGDVPEDKVEPLLMIEAPRLLFPFLRAQVAQLTREGGFAPLMISPIDFHALYRDHNKKRAAAQAGGEPAASA
ncbi:MAG TPA: protein-export chaperone SecB [Dongiaceae bacterium]|jgi:preprotein translocase subunit SecB